MRKESLFEDRRSLAWAIITHLKPLCIPCEYSEIGATTLALGNWSDSILYSWGRELDDLNMSDNMSNNPKYELEIKYTTHITLGELPSSWI